MASSDCRKKKISDLKKRRSGASNAPVREAIGKVGDTLESAAKAQLATLRSLLKVNEIIIENFILFPLNTIIATAETTAFTLTRPLAALGIGKDCPDTERVVKASEKSDKSSKGKVNKYKSMQDSAEISIEKQKEVIGELETSVEVSSDLKSVRDDV
jgi:hypothetical protein